MNFDTAFDILMGFEGGYVNNPNDPGGETNWGVTKSEAIANGYIGKMKDLPVSFAKQIYWQKYWGKIQIDQLPDLLRYSVFDAAVNSGPAQAIKWLQRAVCVNDDGIIGPQTLSAVKTMSADVVLRNMLSQRLIFMTSLPQWGTFGKGWARRIGGLLKS